MSNDAYHNSGMMDTFHDLWVDHEREKIRRELVHRFDNDFDRYPLPIHFNEYEEAKALRLRKRHIEEAIDRLLNISDIRYRKKYFHK